jgi:hypothetical protein
VEGRCGTHSQHCPSVQSHQLDHVIMRQFLAWKEQSPLQSIVQGFALYIARELPQLWAWLALALLTPNLENLVDGFVHLDLPQQFCRKPARIKHARDMSREANLEPEPPLNACALVAISGF